MPTNYPSPLTSPVDPPRIAPRAGKPAPWRPIGGTVHYDGARDSRLTTVIAVLIAAGLHLGLFYGFGPPKKKTVRPADTDLVAVNLSLPVLNQPDEPEPLPDDAPAEKPDLSAIVPMLADLPQVPRPGDFTQAIDFSSLVDRPDLSKTKMTAIPEHIGRGGGNAGGRGFVFNLADLDRNPEPIVQPTPVYPSAYKREGIIATVRVEFIVDITGTVVNAVVVESTHSGFNEAATTGVSKWKFKAGIKNGHKVNARMLIPIIFKVVDGTN